jgi:trehalose/maltose transport system permease protein
MPSSAPTESGTSHQRARIRTAWLFLTPMLLALAVVAVWPLVRTFGFAFTDASLSAPGAASFIGFENFAVQDGGYWYGLISDPLWWLSVKNTLIFAFGSVTIEMLLGVTLALVMNASFPGRGLFRAAVLIPWAIPTVVSAKMWAWMLHDQFGVVNHVLLEVGLIAQPIAWLADPDLTMFSVILVDAWKTSPFVALLALAALQMLPKDCYEAARVDGIHPVRVFFGVTLPLIWPALVVAMVFRMLDALRVFDVVYIMTGNVESTMTMSVYARQQLVDFQDVGYGSAASTLLFMIIAIMTALYLTVLKADVVREGR